MDRYLNRLKVVIAERHKTNLWLSQTLGKDPTTRLTDLRFKMELASEMKSEYFLILKFR